MTPKSIPTLENAKTYIQNIHDLFESTNHQGLAVDATGILNALNQASSLVEVFHRSDLTDGEKAILYFAVAGSFSDIGFANNAIDEINRLNLLQNQVVPDLVNYQTLHQFDDPDGVYIAQVLVANLGNIKPSVVAEWLSSKTTAGVAQSFDVSTHSTPLVLDLDGDGVELTALSGAGTVPVYWDSNNDGFREAMAWVKADDGLLVRDLNGNGVIDDHSELFGSAATDGFAALAVLDSNHDHFITSADAAFPSLKVWRDLNQDGYSQASELFTLAQLNITSINLTATHPANLSVAGNPIASQSTFTMGGQSHSIVDALLATDLINSIDTRPVTIDPLTLFLPQLRGYGTIPDLTIEMSRDPTLLNMVSDFAHMSLDQLFTPNFNLRDAITNIMFRWAGVDNVDPLSRGNEVDARELAFLEKLLGQPFAEVYIQGHTNPDNAAVVRNLDAAWEQAYENLGGRLLLQTVGGHSLLPGLAYDLTADEFSGTFTFDAVALAQVEALAPGSSAPPQPYLNPDTATFWVNVVDLLDSAGLSDADGSQLNVAIKDTSYFLDLATVRDMVSAKIGIDFTDYQKLGVLNGTKYSDQFFAVDGKDSLISGGAGDDRLIGDVGSDRLIGGTGDDVMYGGAGSDTYVIALGDGHDVIDDGTSTEADTIEFGPGISPADITVRQANFTDLTLTFANSDQSITLRSWLSGDHSADRITFANGVVWSGQTLITASLVPTDGDDGLQGDRNANVFGGHAGNDTLVGLGGDDRISGDDGDDFIDGGDGNDVLDGGAGDDYVSGGAGNDTLSGGDGNDRLVDVGGGVNSLDGGAGDDRIEITGGSGSIEGGSGRDTVVAALQDLAGYTLANVEVLETSSSQPIELTVQQVAAFSSIRIADGFVVPVSVKLTSAGTANFAASAPQGIIVTASASGNTIITGAGNDTLTGGAGNDVLFGGGGNDTLTGGAGDDTFAYGLGYGANTITDFVAGNGTVDKISLFGFSSVHAVTDVLARATQSGANTVIDFGGGDVLTLRNVTRTSLSASDFTFSSDRSPAITSNGGGDAAAVTVGENTTAVTSVAAIDPDPGTALIYSIVGGADRTKFQINASTGALSFITAPDFEAPGDADQNNSYAVAVRVGDGALFDTQMINVNVVNGNDPPKVFTTEASVFEGTNFGTYIDATDQDPGTVLFYSIVGGPDASRFSIDSAAGQLLFLTPPDYEAPTDADHNNSYIVTVRASDGVLFEDRTVTINVLNVESLIVGNFGNNTLVGGAENDTLEGLGGNDTLVGGASNDTLTGGSGNDTLDGGPGIDTAVYTVSASSYTLLSYNGTIAVLTHGTDGNDRLQNIEKLQFADQTFDATAAALFDPLEYIASNPDLIVGFGANAQAGFDHYVDHGFAEGRQTHSFDTLEYLASNTDLIQGYGLNLTAAEQHYVGFGFKEGRVTHSFDALEYLASNADLIQGYGLNLTAAEQHYVGFGFKEGRATHSFDALEYLASNTDLIQGYGLNLTAAEQHYVSAGFNESRATHSFDALEYLASNTDLIQGYGLNLTAAEQHYVSAGFNESRATHSFDALEYLASNTDLIRGYGLNLTAAEQHYVSAGFKESRATHSFDALEYLASNTDLIQGYGLNLTAAEQHYVSAGFNEGRATHSFDALEYLASNTDLIQGYGLNLTAAEQHYVSAGFKEGRQTHSFDALEYLASNTDLIQGYGFNLVAAEQHYVGFGFKEGRQTHFFDPEAYLSRNPDLLAAYGHDDHAATVHWVTHGFFEGREWMT